MSVQIRGTNSGAPEQGPVKTMVREWLAVAIAALAIVITISNQVGAAGENGGRTTNRLEALEKRMEQIESQFNRVTADIAYLRAASAKIEESTTWLKLWISRAEEARGVR